MDTALSVRLSAVREKREEYTWITAARAGEPWALEQLFHTFQPQVYSLCFRVLHRREDAQDATQAAFVRAFQNLHRFRGDSCLRTWVYRIAVNECLTLLRKQKDVTDLSDDLQRDPADPAVVERLAVEAALNRVSPEHRLVLILRFWEGLEYEEIASVLGISLPAVKMRIHRARTEFRKRYESRP